ncbi:hypothetical protein DL237_01735 [Pseudooceanicola sediminis]|uniref:Uncharacterized protein n=1 Tax=Pseudooceanicola sediminis TaxID=2211117 RepID=A0A399J5S1_9RHOB|nr:hypothetical protein [Pseudooceanicola sediminis]KAA2316788.1 hypothetical protein E0K93_00185 [Puniceibacterium sp. HSS470]RII40755.1 hypothetical protein DL237_01735 [Pseudooceanicola sediminis]|tara:strand:- start:235930 stop:236307 length:378 start_codon:yes stop_codon:yes gene_type:complete
MFGIVLWSAADDSKAVVWCEDHGDLAFLHAKSDSKANSLIGLEQGDLLQFDVAEQGDMRLVQNARLVAENHCPSLANRLKESDAISKAASEKPHSGTPRAAERAIVVPFPGPPAPRSVQRFRQFS